MTAAFRHALDALAILAGSLLFAATLWLVLAGPAFVQPDRVSSAAVAARGTP